MMRKIMLILGICMIVLSGCKNPYSEPEDEYEPGNEPISLVDELFKDAGTQGTYTTTHFTTNNPKYWSSQGYSLWTKWDSGAATPFVEREVTMSKSSGSSRAGYGLVICQGERTVDSEQKNTMLIVMINAEGKYFIGKVIGSVCENIQWWKSSSYLNRGIGPNNKIKVTYDDTQNKFSLIINNYTETTFADQTAPIHEGGRNGYVVITAPEDRFPSTSVDVYFKEQR